jgi:hypothetical protein
MPDKDKVPIKPTPPEKPKPPKPIPPKPAPMDLPDSYKEGKKPKRNLEELIQEAMKVKRP